MTWLNDSDPAPEKRIATIDHPNRIALAITYGLPFGKGRHFNINSRLLDLLAGGWDLNNVYTYQTGAPIAWVNGSSTSGPGDYVYFGAPLDVNNRRPANGGSDMVFNTAAFDTKSTDAFNYHL